MRLLLLTFLALPALLRADGLTFAKPSLELNADVDSKSIIADFPFTNDIGKPITILRHESGCSCLAIEPVGKKLQYEPGESGILRATLEKGRSTGTVEKNIRLWLVGDPADKPSSVLKLSVQIPELIGLSVKSVSWKIGAPGTETSVKITMNGKSSIRITDVSCTSPNFPHSIKTLVEGKSYELNIGCISTDVRAMGVFKIETDSADETQHVAQIFGIVR